MTILSAILIARKPKYSAVLRSLVWQPLCVYFSKSCDPTYWAAKFRFYRCPSILAHWGWCRLRMKDYLHCTMWPEQGAEGKGSFSPESTIYKPCDTAKFAREKFDFCMPTRDPIVSANSMNYLALRQFQITRRWYSCRVQIKSKYMSSPTMQSK